MPTPTLTVHRLAEDVVEYRAAVAQQRSSSLSYLLLAICAAGVWAFTGIGKRVLFTVGVVAVIWNLTTTVLYESAVVFTPHGLQLETHRGLPKGIFHRAIRLSTSRVFIPQPAIMDVVIHEGLWGWNVRYYLAALCREPEKNGDKVVIRVLFKNVMPYLPVLKQVYLGLREDLFLSASPVPAGGPEED